LCAMQEDPVKFQQREQEAHNLGLRATSLKEYLVSLDIRRQGNRSAQSALRQNPPPEGKVWMAAGDIFIRFDVAEAKKVMVQDSSSVEDEIDSTRAELKAVIESIQALYGESDESFSRLKGMSSKEVDGALGNSRQQD
jgi:hypothetical protein